MSETPIPACESARLDSLRRCRILDTDPESSFDELVDLAAELCNVPIALVSLVDRDRQWFKAKTGIDVDETPRSVAFCGYVVYEDKPFIVEDATQDPRTQDNPLVTGDPHIRFYAGIPLRTSDELPLGTLCIIDTTPRKLTSTQLKQLQVLAAQVSRLLELRQRKEELENCYAEAVAANTAKSQFLANMSHEIRTPMTSIIGYAEVLLDEHGLEEASPDQAFALQCIHRNGQHLLHLINEILDLSKIEANKFSIEKQQFGLRKLLEEISVTMQSRAEAKGITFEHRHLGSLPECIETDPTRLRQILYNIIGNAIKFTPTGTVQMVTRYAGADQTLTIDVEDSGIGIPEAHHDEIFEPFSQADASMTRRFGGTGLGLIISKRLAELMGGRLSLLWSEPAVGSCFRASIHAPVSFAEDPTEQSYRQRRRPTEEMAKDQLQGVRVLLAEDSPDSQRLIQHILQKAGATVTAVDNGQIAVSLLLESAAAGDRFDLILMDMQMPVLDGYSATSALRRGGFDLPIIALTAHAMPGDRRKCLQAGCDDYFTKPVNRKELIAMVQSHRRPQTANESDQKSLV